MFSGSRSGVRCAHRARGLQHYGGLAGTVWQALIKSSASPRRVVSAETTGRNEMTPVSIRPRGNLGDVLTAGPSISRYVMSENVEKGDNLDSLKRRFSSLSTRYSHITYETTTARERETVERVSSLFVSLKLFCLLNMRRLVFISILAGSPMASSCDATMSSPFSTFLRRKESFSIFFSRSVTLDTKRATN